MGRRSADLGNWCRDPSAVIPGSQEFEMPCMPFGSSVLSPSVSNIHASLDGLHLFPQLSALARTLVAPCGCWAKAPALSSSLKLSVSQEPEAESAFSKASLLIQGPCYV